MSDATINNPTLVMLDTIDRKIADRVIVLDVGLGLSRHLGALLTIPQFGIGHEMAMRQEAEKLRIQERVAVAKRLFERPAFAPGGNRAEARRHRAITRANKKFKLKGLR